MSAKVIPFRKNHQDFRANQCNQDAPSAKIEDSSGIKSHASAQAHGGVNSTQNGQHQQDAVGGKMERSDVDQKRMQTLSFHALDAADAIEICRLERKPVQEREVPGNNRQLVKRHKRAEQNQQHP